MKIYDLCGLYGQDKHCDIDPKLSTFNMCLPHVGCHMVRASGSNTCLVCAVVVITHDYIFVPYLQ